MIRMEKARHLSWICTYARAAWRQREVHEYDDSDGKRSGIDSTSFLITWWWQTPVTCWAGRGRMSTLSSCKYRGGTKFPFKKRNYSCCTIHPVSRSNLFLTCAEMLTKIRSVSSKNTSPQHLCIQRIQRIRAHNRKLRGRAVHRSGSQKHFPCY